MIQRTLVRAFSVALNIFHSCKSASNCGLL
jgi:hypothetical protein